MSQSADHSLANSQISKRLIEDSVSRNTQRAYASQLRRLQAWLNGRVLNDSALAEYVGWLYQRGCAAATAAQAVAACKFQARMAREPDPLGALTGRALAGFRRDVEARKRGRGQASGISAAQAEAMAVVAGEEKNSMRGLRDAAIISVMSDAMLRVSEAVALRVEDVTAREDGSGRLRIRQAKTDPNGEGKTLYLGPPALRRFLDWLAAANIHEGLAFRPIRRGGHVLASGLSTNAARRIVKEWAVAVGIDGGRVSGQSLRIGMAQTLAAAGASLVEMQLAGRWRSPRMPAHYASGERAGRNAVARLIYAQAMLRGNEYTTAQIAAGIQRQILRLADQFHAAGNSAGKQAAAVLRSSVDAAKDRRGGRGAARVALSRGTESQSGEQWGDAAHSVHRLLAALSNLAETWRLEREAEIRRRAIGR